MYARKLLSSFAEAQTPQASGAINSPAFYRNLEQALDIRRRDQNLFIDKPDLDHDLADFASSDLLSLNKNGQLRQAVLDELSRHPDFVLGPSGSRAVNGGSKYLFESEAEVARITGADAAYILHSGFLANLAALSAIPQPGDAIVYDSLVHASLHEGMLLSRATHRIPFMHNDPDSLRDVLVSLFNGHREFREGTRSILVAVESVYSMDGDVCPLAELLHVAREVFPAGNAQFLVDEAHCVGLVGPRGAGLVRMLGLENQVAVRVQTCSKSLGSCGGVILGKKSIVTALLNTARCCVFSATPPFLTIASIRLGYRLLGSGETEQAQERLQRTIRYFYATITGNPIYDAAVDEGILQIPSAEDWETQSFVTHIVPVITRARYNHYLYLHLLLIAKINTVPVGFPAVPKGTDRVRVVLHAHNSDQEVETIAHGICDWAREMLDIEARGGHESILPKAARQAYALQ